MGVTIRRRALTACRKAPDRLEGLHACPRLAPTHLASGTVTSRSGPTLSPPSVSPPVRRTTWTDALRRACSPACGASRTCAYLISPSPLERLHFFLHKIPLSLLVAAAIATLSNAGPALAATAADDTPFSVGAAAFLLSGGVVAAFFAVYNAGVEINDINSSRGDGGPVVVIAPKKRAQ